MKDSQMLSRRKMLGGATAYTAAITAVAAAASVSKVAMAALPEPVFQTKPDTMPPLVPNSGRPYNPVVTLNGWTLPWRMNQGVKEFHLLAEPVVREMAPGFKAHLWGDNGQSQGPTIEVGEGDRAAAACCGWCSRPRRSRCRCASRWAVNRANRTNLAIRGIDEPRCKPK